MKVLILITVLLVVSACEPAESQTEQFYCGRQLAEALAYLCDNIPEGSAGKRSDRNEVYYNHRWLTPHTGHAFGGPRGKRQGIIRECCENPCSINVLLSYCSYD